MERDQAKFVEEREKNHLMRLVQTLKIANMKAYKYLYRHFMDGEDIPYIKEGDIIKIILPADEVFEKAYGKLVVSFKGQIARPFNICDIQPRAYLEACHRGMPINYRGVTIPNTVEDKNKVDDAQAKINFHKQLARFTK